jgi:FkbM family methyltransferase
MDALERALMTISCPDADLIPKVPDAGRIKETPEGSVQIMHNGLKVVAGGYHGNWMAHIIRGLRGHHEPQEELLFNSLLRFSRHDSLIVELGAFWAYYTLWYLQEIPGARAICIEPDPANLAIGVKNAALNGFSDQILFQNAWIGGEAQKEYTAVIESTNGPMTLPCLNMDSVLPLTGERVIEILHMDIQGAELPFLKSMQKAVTDGLVRFLVVSTHHSSISGSKTTHADCMDAIRNLGGTILEEHDVQESFSGDGLIVASFFLQDGQITLPTISRNTARNSLFPEL